MFFIYADNFLYWTLIFARVDWNSKLTKSRCLNACIVCQALQIETCLNNFGIKLLPYDFAPILPVNLLAKLIQTLLHFDIPSLQLNIPLFEKLLSKVHKLNHRQLLISFLKLCLKITFK